MSNTPKQRGATPKKESTTKGSALSPTYRRNIILVLLALLVIVAVCDGWVWSCSRRSVARLEQELAHRQVVGVPLLRRDVPQFLSGWPSHSDVGNEQLRRDSFTWRGLLYHHVVWVDSNANDAVEKIEIGEAPVAEFQPASDTATKELDKQRIAGGVEASLMEAEQRFRQSGLSLEFRDLLLSVIDHLPEAKVSTIKGQLVWNSFRLPRQQRKLFAFQFTVPQAEPADLDIVRWVNHSETSGILATGDKDKWLAASRRGDREENVRINGVDLPQTNQVEFDSQSLQGCWPAKRFIVWFFTGDNDPNADFECKTVLFLSEAGTSPLRRGIHEVSEHIGLRPNVPEFSPTPDGVRDALAALDRRLNSGVIGPASHGRILRSVHNALPELTVSTEPGQSQWQKLDFGHSDCAAARILIPDSTSEAVDLYGAIVADGRLQFGWDCSQQLAEDLRTRTLLNVELPDSPVGQSSRLTMFSYTDCCLDPAQEATLWFRREDGSKNASIFLRLLAVPHPETYEAYRIHADVKPASCAKLLGLELPLPAAPGSTVLASLEKAIIYLAFTPDSRKLVDVDISKQPSTLPNEVFVDDNRVRIWDLETGHEEGRFSLPEHSTEKLIITPDSQTIISFDEFGSAAYRWDVNTRKSKPKWEGREDPFLNWLGGTIGPKPYQLVVIPWKHARGADGWAGKQVGFITIDFNTNMATEHAGKAIGYSQSLVFLPSMNCFAVGLSRATLSTDRRTGRFVSTVQLWSSDFSRLLRELPLSDHRDQPEPENGNFVRLAYYPGGRRLAAIARRGHLKVWDIATWTELLSKPTSTPLLELSLSPDEESVATIVPDSNAVSLWTIADGQQQGAWQVDQFAITEVAHSPDGKWVATANSEGVIRLWKNVPRQ